MEELIVDATLLRNNASQKRRIEEYVRDILLNINTTVRQAQQNGEYYIIVELPIIFDIPNMKQKDSQRIVWSQIIEILQKKKYNIKLNDNATICRLKISWMDKDYAMNANRESDILSSCRERF